jgi:predicted  nucleic acid-binding Zn-ribbon protein
MADLKAFAGESVQIMSRSLNKVLVSDIIVEPKAGTAAPKAATLEAHHQRKMTAFESEKEEVVRLRADLADVELRLESAEVGSDEWQTLSDTVTALRAQIAMIESDDRRLDYFLDVGDMLFQYYEAQESLARGDIQPAMRMPKRMPANSVMSYFATPAPEVSKPVVATPATPAKASLIDCKDGLNRDKMLEKYLAIVEPEAIKSGILPGSGIEPGWGRCSSCEEEMMFYQNEAKLGCPACGQEEFILVDSEKPSYKDPPREITYFAYKKQNHFNEWLAQFQAKENTDIPQDVIEAVLGELRKERISDPKRVKKEKILEILRKLKLSKMYDHVQQIKNRIQQQMTSLTLSKEVEEKLQHMFKEIQPAFIKYCPKGRSNFLSYPYVLYKMCQLLEMDEFLPCFQLLKSREKLYQQDQVWQKICEELGWQFIRSI